MLNTTQIAQHLTISYRTIAIVNVLLLVVIILKPAGATVV
jgi:hypothetical protein